MAKKYENIKESERRRVERLLNAGLSLRRIAERLNRSASSISEEVRRNSTAGRYESRKANHKAYTRRKYAKIQCMKVATNPELKRFVIENISNDQSPEGISGRMREIETRLKYASVKAIYKFVKSVHGRQIEKHLYSKAVKKKSGPKRGIPVAIDGRTMIDKRPKKIEKRLEFGHFEGDFIESGKDGKGSLLVIAERKTRYPFLGYLKNRDTKSVNEAAEELLRDIPIKSLTIDNDISFQKHKELSEMLDAAIFFCHPQSPGEKGTIENRNKAIRRYVPKRSDLSKYGDDYFRLVEHKLRNRFMKCLNFKTPQEAFNQEMMKLKFETKNTASILMWYHEKEKLLTNQSVRVQGCA